MPVHLTEIKAFKGSYNRRVSVIEALELAKSHCCEVRLEFGGPGSDLVTLSIEPNDAVNPLMLRLQEASDAAKQRLHPRYRYSFGPKGQLEHDAVDHVFLGRCGKHDLHAFLFKSGVVLVEARYGNEPDECLLKASDDPGRHAEVALAEAWRQVIERGLMLQF